MSEYVAKAFVVFVNVPAEDGQSLREIFVVGCSTREEAEATIKGLYPSEKRVRPFALALSARETEELQLAAGEIRRGQ